MQTQGEVNEIMAGMDKALANEEKDIQKIAPRCHLKPMVLRDFNEGDNWDNWWECSICGYTKPL